MDRLARPHWPTWRAAVIRPDSARLRSTNQWPLFYHQPSGAARPVKKHGNWLVSRASLAWYIDWKDADYLQMCSLASYILAFMLSLHCIRVIETIDCWIRFAVVYVINKLCFMFGSSVLLIHFCLMHTVLANCFNCNLFLWPGEGFLTLCIEVSLLSKFCCLFLISPTLDMNSVLANDVEVKSKLSNKVNVYSYLFSLLVSTYLVALICPVFCLMFITFLVNLLYILSNKSLSLW